jgi:hypothetical protein
MLASFRGQPGIATDRRTKIINKQSVSLCSLCLIALDWLNVHRVNISKSRTTNPLRRADLLL